VLGLPMRMAARSICDVTCPRGILLQAVDGMGLSCAFPSSTSVAPHISGSADAAAQCQTLSSELQRYQTVMQYQLQLMMKMQNDLRSLQVKTQMSHKHNRCESELPCECSTALIEEMIAGASGSAGNAGHGSAAISSHCRGRSADRLCQAGTGANEPIAAPRLRHLF
jgi:hypothetical protein